MTTRPLTRSYLPRSVAPDHPLPDTQRGLLRAQEAREPRRQECAAAAVVFWDPGAA